MQNWKDYQSSFKILCELVLKWILQIISLFYHLKKQKKEPYFFKQKYAFLSMLITKIMIKYNHF
jgi:hypothetical protein